MLSQQGGVEKLVSRLAHNQKNGGSNPPSATREKKRQVKKMLFKKIRESKMPMILKVAIYAVLLVTVVYWALWLAYKVVDVLRALVHTFTDKGHFWFMILFMIGLSIVILVLMEYGLIDAGYKPISEVLEWVRNKYEYVRGYIEAIIESIKGVRVLEQ